MLRAGLVLLEMAETVIPSQVCFVLHTHMGTSTYHKHATSS